MGYQHGGMAPGASISKQSIARQGMAVEQSTNSIPVQICKHTGAGKCTQQIEGRKKMGMDVDEYIANFETLVWKAGYNLRDDMVVDVFTNGLPAGLYSLIYNIDKPRTYEG